MITFNNVTKTFGDVIGVEDLNFTVDSGEIVGLLGANGAGKTTTMRMMTGYYQPTDGEVEVFGRPIQRDPLSAKKRIGYLPEVPPLHDEMIVDNYLKYVARMQRVAPDDMEESIDRVIDRLGLARQRDRLLGNLSRGFRQRVALAQALIHEPDVLVLDEPTLGLDPKQVREFRDLIEELARNSTLIISSHILPEIRQICERVIILNRGQVVAVDTPQKLAQKIQRGNEWELRISDVPDGWRDRMLDLEGLEEVHEVASGEFQLSFDSGRMENRERLFQLCRDENVPMVRLSPTELDLEEVFLEYTEEEPDESDIQPEDGAEREPGELESTPAQPGNEEEEGEEESL
ncbi:MAG: ABC transporter ATP-binding protein [bacterium]